MSRRRLLLVVDSFSEGNAARHVQAIVGRLSRRHHDVRLVTLYDPDRTTDELERTKIPVDHLALRGGETLQEVGDALREVVGDAELLHAHSLLAGMAANLAAGSVPVVTSVHETPESGGRPLPGDLQPEQVGSALTDAGGPRRILAATGAVRRRLEALGVVDVEVCPPFVDVAGFRERLDSVDRASARRQWNVHRGDVVLLHVGEIRRENRPVDLLEAFRVALRELPSLRLFLAGDGPELPTARALAEDLDLGDAMSFLAGPADLVTVHRAADLFVLPRAGEAFPLGLLDAMAAGLPSVVAGDEPELDPVKAGAGLRAAPGRVEHIAKQVLTLAFDPRERAEMARAAAERASRFDAGRWIPRLEEAYAEL